MTEATETKITSQPWFWFAVLLLLAVAIYKGGPKVYAHGIATGNDLLAGFAALLILF